MIAIIADIFRAPGATGRRVEGLLATADVKNAQTPGFSIFSGAARSRPDYLSTRLIILQYSFCSVSTRDSPTRALAQLPNVISCQPGEHACVLLRSGSRLFLNIQYCFAYSSVKSYPWCLLRCCAYILLYSSHPTLTSQRRAASCGALRRQRHAA